MNRTETILAEVARDGSTRNSIADVYGQAIRSWHRLGSRPDPNDFIDWPTVNGAILKRFKPSGLNYIKQRAWKGL